MKKALSLVFMIFILLFVSGCNSQTKSIPEELKGVKFKQQFSITSEDDEKYIAKIQFQNSTSYDFLPIAVSVEYQIRYVENGVDTIKPNPIQLQAEQITEHTSKKEFIYKVEIPKKLFDVYERTDKENIVVNIEGIFSKNDRIVLGTSVRSEGRLVRD
ncbi:hypothetical protein [Desulfosporosinus nitroreducens]|uniref:hypothetical protein n=1 Tax=Desulfosporosinus nitroreducens TaxID=2018668 RepID=UPI00207CBE03|nr:hypothetical protein [Desulfosporosinus nitroreducens]MCO1604306.1 hypothetical protein [Desulfosporosinus nitroreducens]